MKAFWIGCCIVVAAAVGVAGAAGLYRWVDAEGKVHYGDSPPPDAKKVEQKKFGANVIESSELSYGVQQAAKNFPVTFYANDCDVCGQARQLLAKRGVPYDTKGVEQPEDQAALKKVTGGALEVPVLVVGKTVLRGFEPGQWNRALDEAGYPQSAPAVAKPAKPAAKEQPAAQKPAEESGEQKPY